MAGFRVSTRLALVTVVVLGIIGGVTGAGWVATGSSDPPSGEDPDIRTTVAALAVARHARSLADIASVRTRPDMSPEALAEFKASLHAEAAGMRGQLDLLAGAGREEANGRVAG